MSDIPDDIKATAAEIGEIVFDASVDLYETGVSGTDVNLVIARALLAEREAATKEEREACAAVLDDEAGAMLSQRDELLDEGKLGGHLMRPEHIKGLVRERRDLAEGYTRLATAIRSGARP